MAGETSLLGNIGGYTMQGLEGIGSGLSAIGTEIAGNLPEYGKMATGLGGLYLQYDQANTMNKFAERDMAMKESAFKADEESAKRRRDLRF